MSLPHTQIEYAVNKDGSRGYAWNWLTGCANSPDICKTRETCWAKILAGRFHRDFTPIFHADIFSLSFPRKPGARIMVCFTGDISFASPVNINRAFARILGHPEHTFFLLTKRPKEAYRDIEWPRNAWLGVSLTGAESPERQRQIMDELRAVKGEHKRWVSYEPILGQIKIELMVDWIVVGAQTGKGAVLPKTHWLNYPYPHNNMRIWIKNNMRKFFLYDGRSWPPRQELPND